MAFLTTGSFGELDGAGGFKAAAKSSGEGRTATVGTTPSTGTSLPAGV